MTMETESNCILSINNVSLTYSTLNSSIDALAGVTLTVNQGDFISFVGPSGCGKTSLLKIVAGFLIPTKGSAFFENKIINGPGWERGIVFQQSSLFPWLNVAENVEFGLKMRKIPKKERKEIVHYYLTMVKLRDFHDKFPYELSGGMQQRVALARVLVNDPKILLMDEPFGALDALTREHMQEELLQIWRRTKKTILFVTHSVEEAVYLSTKVVVFSERPGQILSCVPSSFSNGNKEAKMRKVKSLEKFIQLREHILSYIWH